MSPWVLGGAGLGVLLLAVVAVVLVRRRRRSLAGICRRVAWEQLSDVVLPDDVDGEIHLDRVLLTSRQLVVLDIRRIDGTLFAGDELDTWTALHPKGRRTLRNPLAGLKARLHAVRAITGDADVTGYVLALGEIKFRGEPPAGLITLDALQGRLGARDSRPPETLQAAWARLVKAARRLPGGVALD